MNNNLEDHRDWSRPLLNVAYRLESQNKALRELVGCLKFLHGRLNSKASQNNLYQVYELIDEMGIELEKLKQIKEDE